MGKKKRKYDGENEITLASVQTPKSLHRILDRFVIGQDEAKKALSVVVYNQYKRFIEKMSEDGYTLRDKRGRRINSGVPKELKDVMVDKSNLLMFGNTGTGKTYMVKILSRILGLPCYIADCTKLTESGYVGDDVETVLTGLLNEADGDVEIAQLGICILDEFDKLGRRGDNPSITRDVGGEGVQQSLLKLVEGTTIGVSPVGGRKHPEQPLIEMDTSDILFIGMGSFDGIDKIVERRVDANPLGFNGTKKRRSEDEKTMGLLSKVRQDDLKKFGIIPELIGRFPIITHTNPLSEDDLLRIMTEPENSLIKQYRKILSMDKVNLSFDEKGLRLVAKVANSTKTGARGLRGILDTVLTDIMYDYGGNRKPKNVTIGVDYITESLKDKYDLEKIDKRAA